MTLIVLTDILMIFYINIMTGNTETDISVMLVVML